MYKMKDEYLTGIEFIDAEHTKLFEIANRIYGIMKDEFIPDKYDYIVEVLQELRDYTHYHFQHEEEYMKQIHYKRILSQIVSHKDFIEKLDSYNLEKVDEEQEQTILQLLEFLNDWLVEHICKSDKMIAE